MKRMQNEAQPPKLSASRFGKTIALCSASSFLRGGTLLQCNCGVPLCLKIGVPLLQSEVFRGGFGFSYIFFNGKANVLSFKSGGREDVGGVHERASPHSV